MSIFFVSGDTQLYNPGTASARIYREQVVSLARELDIASGLGPIVADEVKVDAGQFIAFVRTALAFSEKAGSRLVRLISPCLSISIVLAERLDRPDFVEIPDHLRHQVAAVRLEFDT